MAAAIQSDNADRLTRCFELSASASEYRYGGAGLRSGGLAVVEVRLDFGRAVTICPIALSFDGVDPRVLTSRM